MKRLLALAMVTALVLGLCACGSSQTAAPAATEAAPAATQAAAPAATEAAVPAATEAAPAAPEASNEGDAMKAMWYQAVGIDTMFESPWWDLQNLGVYGIFEGLVAQETDGATMKGVLATDWTVSDDGLTYTFNIRPNVKWHDGETLTSEEVALSLSAAAESPVVQIGKATLSMIEGAAAAAEAAAADPAAKATMISGITFDDTSVTVKITAVNKMFLTELANHKVLPMHIYKDIPLLDLKTLETYVGTGPYMINKVQFPDFYTVTAFPEYWGEQPGIKNMIFTSYIAGGNDAAVNAVITGDLDYVYGNAMNDIAVAKNITTQNPDTTFVIQSSTYNRKLFCNLFPREDGKTKADLQKKEVRQAFNLLLDKEAMASVYAGQAEALTTFVPNNNPLFNSDIPKFQRNVEEAKKLLDAAGFDYSQTYEVYTAYTDSSTTDLLSFMKQNFSEAGINLEFYQVDTGTWSTVSAGKNYDFFYGSNGATTNAVQQYEKVISTWSQDYGNKEGRAALYDADYSAWLATADESAARKYSDALQATLIDDCYQIPIYAMNTIVTYNNRVTVPADLLVYDNQQLRDWHWADWKLN